MRKFIIFPVIICVFVTAVIAVFCFILVDKNESVAQIAVSEFVRVPQITFNQTIIEAVTICATAPYRIYSSDELHKYFISEIAEEILLNYEPVIKPYEETQIEFEEQSLPEIGSILITLEDGYYAVKLKFGEVFYNYRLVVSPNKIITQITDGGVTFE